MATTSKRAAHRAPITRLEIAALNMAAIYGALAEKILDVPDGNTAQKIADEALFGADVLIGRESHGVVGERS